MLSIIVHQWIGFCIAVRQGFPINEFWVPIIPATSTVSANSEQRVPPRRLRAVIAEVRYGGGLDRDFEKSRLRIESQGYQGTVLNGLRRISSRAQRQLLAQFPDTKVEDMIVLDAATRPPSAAYVQGCL